MSGTLSTAEPLHAIAGFAALLREHGFAVGIAEQQAMVQAALRQPPGARFERFDAAWRAIACHGARDWRRWPELSQGYWQPQRVRGSTRVSGQTRTPRDMRQLVHSLHEQLSGQSLPPGGARPGLDAALSDAQAAGGDDAGAPRAQGGASRTEALHDRRFSEWLPQDLALLQALAERIARALRRRLTRRWHERAQGRRLDLRRTLRRSLATGGVPFAPAWREARRELPRLFILVDVSRSMETHAQLFLRIARAFVHAAGARVFVFHTRLAEISPLLQRDSAAVQEKVNAVTAGFAGGTRIATSLADFEQVHARGQLNRSARVWVLSDGFDADAPQELAGRLQRLRQRGAHITWWHPGEAPPAGEAMQAVRAASPALIDRFVRLNRLHDLAAAAELVR